MTFRDSTIHRQNIHRQDNSETREIKTQHLNDSRLKTDIS